MKKILAVASATLMLSSVAGVSVAHHNDDHDSNYHGMCTAYFSGSENGQGNKRDNGNAFITFVETVGDYDGDGDPVGDAYDVAAFCNDMTGGFGNPGGGNSPFFDPAEDDCAHEDETARAECEALADQEGGTTPGESNGNTKNKGGDS